MSDENKLIITKCLPVYSETTITIVSTTAASLKTDVAKWLILQPRHWVR